jgi:hypothetical protein
LGGVPLCSANCTTCTNITNCTQCSTGYKLNSTYACEQTLFGQVQELLPLEGVIVICTVIPMLILLCCVLGCIFCKRKKVLTNKKNIHQILPSTEPRMDRAHSPSHVRLENSFNQAAKSDLSVSPI